MQEIKKEHKVPPNAYKFKPGDTFVDQDVKFTVIDNVPQIYIDLMGLDFHNLQKGQIYQRVKNAKILYKLTLEYEPIPH